MNPRAGNLVQTCLDVGIDGRNFQLLGQKGLFWPSQRTLVVGDLHLGKDATFRRHSIPVPSGSTKSTLDRVASMLESTGAERLLFLGDLFHARSSLTDDAVLPFVAFLDRHRDLEMILVEGNHDVSTGVLPASWPIHRIDETHLIDGVGFTHDPAHRPLDGRLHVCAHVHPAIRLPGRDTRGKAACFWRSGQNLLIPAIGDFTGTHVIRPNAEDDVWIVAEECVFPVPENAFAS